MFCNSVVVAFQCVVLAISCKCVVAFLDPQLVELWMLQRSVRCVVWAAALSAFLSNWSIGQQCRAINPGSVPHSPPTLPSLPPSLSVQMHLLRCRKAFPFVYCFHYMVTKVARGWMLFAVNFASPSSSLTSHSFSGGPLGRKSSTPCLPCLLCPLSCPCHLLAPSVSHLQG